MVSQYYAKNHGFNFGNGAWLFLSLVIDWTKPLAFFGHKSVKKFSKFVNSSNEDHSNIIQGFWKMEMKNP